MVDPNPYVRRSRRRRSRARGFQWLLWILIALVAWGVWRLAGGNGEASAASSLPHTVTDSLEIVKMADSSVPQHIVRYQDYTVNYNSRHHLPNYVAWTTTAREAREQLVSRSDDFHADESVPGCADPDDYRRSGYDRGHMKPAAESWSDPVDMYESFSMANMCPQAGDLNRGAWKTLEDNCRRWAIRDSAVVVIAGPVLTDRLDPDMAIGQSRVSVPRRFFKVVLTPYTRPVRAIGYVMPNAKVPGGMQAAAVSVDEVERITGMDFFSSLPDDVEAVAEASVDQRPWTRR